MKVKICNLLRATTYLQLIVATLMMVWLTYDAFVNIDLSFGKFLFLTIITAAALQAIYSIAVVRLIHYYAPGHRIPDKSFLYFYKILVGLNIAVGAGLVVWFAVQLTYLLLETRQYGISNPLQSLQLCILGSYAIIAIYTIAGAAKLKRAILQRREWQIENWLEEMSQMATA